MIESLNKEEAEAKTSTKEKYKYKSNLIYNTFSFIVIVMIKNLMSSPLNHNIQIYPSFRMIWTKFVRCKQQN